MVSRIFIFCFTFLISGAFLFGQSDIGNSDLSKVKVEELSDSQIQQIMQRAEQSGMTESQMKTALSNPWDVTKAELQKLEKRLNSMRTGQTKHRKLQIEAGKLSSSGRTGGYFLSISEAR